MGTSQIIYIYRGQIERGSRYAWRDGYSETSKTGGVNYPWMTKKECYKDARIRGCKAIFLRRLCEDAKQ